MKKLLLSIFSLATAMLTLAESKMIVVLKDGSEVEYSVKDVDSLRFEKVLTDTIINGHLDTIINGHLFVDLGLPSGTKWAAENLGTDSIDTLGQYYAWGEIATKKSFYTESAPSYNKRFADLYEAGIIGEDSVLTAEHDAATAIWGEGCRMPTKEEFQELIDNCTFNLNLEAKGYDVVGKNGKSIFLPFAGNIFRTDMYYFGTEGRIWTSTFDEGNSTAGSAWIFSYTEKGVIKLISDHQSGRSIRPVTK